MRKKYSEEVAKKVCGKLKHKYEDASKDKQKWITTKEGKHIPIEEGAGGQAGSQEVSPEQIARESPDPQARIQAIAQIKSPAELKKIAKSTNNPMIKHAIERQLEELFKRPKGFYGRFYNNLELGEQLRIPVDEKIKVSQNVNLTDFWIQYGAINQIETYNELPQKIKDMVKEVRIYNEITEDPKLRHKKDKIPCAYKAVGWERTYKDTGGICFTEEDICIIRSDRRGHTLLHEVGHVLWMHMKDREKEDFEKIHSEVEGALRKLKQDYEANDVQELFAEAFKGYYDSKIQSKKTGEQSYQLQLFPVISKFMRERMRKYLDSLGKDDYDII